MFWFPNELPDFIVLKHIYEDSMARFVELMEQNKVIGQTFKSKKTNGRVKVVNVVSKEPSLFPESNWETVLYIN